MNDMYIIGIIAVTIFLFFVFREIILWYWKINETIKNQKEMIRLLKKIAGEEEAEEEMEEQETADTWKCPRCDHRNSNDIDKCTKCKCELI